MTKKIHRQVPEPRQRPAVVSIIAGGVLLTGLLTILSILSAQVRARTSGIVSADAQITALVGLSLVYLAALLRRGKYNAWLIALPLFVFIIVRNFKHYVYQTLPDADDPIPVAFNLIVPSAGFAGLILSRGYFNVRSEPRSAAIALRRSVIILAVAFLYGVLGFQLLDKHDFHQEITVLTGAHYTIDQFGLTTVHQLTPYTRRAHVFLDSLGAVSIGSIFYVAISFFAPIRFRLANQDQNRQQMEQLLKDNPFSSEDFFKLWPRDKAYFFNHQQTAGLAYKVSRRVALVVADPAGKRSDFADLIEKFEEYCRLNDWQLAFIHTDSRNAQIYKQLDFSQQKIGQEAIVNVGHFQSSVATNKYFRNVARKFERSGFACELLQPPHSPAVIKRLREISNDWLELPGRSERGFMMGNFSESYMQQGPIMVARDDAGTIRAFINQIPSFDPDEANFDLLRAEKDAPTNINDYLMLNFINLAHQQGFKRLNMGLCPLAGLDDSGDEEKSLIDRTLGFVYSAGGRFYSFEGLEKFKAKYEPDWQDRFIVYRGGLSGFGQVLNALLNAMKL